MNGNTFKYSIIATLIAFAVSSGAKSQRNTLSGKVSEAGNNTPLAGVSVYVSDLKTGTITDINGNYELRLPRGRYIVKYSFVGYEPAERSADLTGTIPVIDVTLKSDNKLEAVVVSAAGYDNVKSAAMGVEKMNIVEIKKVPALMGEVDIIKVVQLLPGVQPAAEGGSGFSVRGSPLDQNLIMLDNTVIYNASHIMGFFSVFNNDAVSNLDLYKGDLPLKYGGRLASVLDITTIDNNPQKFAGTGGIGIISSRLMMEAPVGKKTNVMVSGRRSYADLFLKLSGDEALRNSTMYFYDLNAKITCKIGDKDKIVLSGYYGTDRFKTDVMGLDYGNGTATLIWSRLYNEKLSSKVNLNLTGYDYLIGSDAEGMTIDWKSKIFDLQLRADANYAPNKNNTLSFGLSSTYHRFSPGEVSGSDFLSYVIPDNYSIESSIYLANEQKIGESTRLKYGLRLTLFQNIGPGATYEYDDDRVIETTEYESGKIYNTYQTFEPRISGVFVLNRSSSIKAGYARNVQFIQLANNSAAGSPMNIWFSAGPKIKPQTVDNFSAGYFRNFRNNTIEFSVEAYCKSLDNVIDFKDHAQLILNKYLDREILIGQGKAYGIEFMLRKNDGRLTGFANYTLSRSERTIEGINDGKTYPAPYDKPHVINLSASYEISRKWSVSSNWIFATGNPTTYPVGRIEVDGEYLPLYSGRNEDRRPNYHRLDLSLNFVPNPHGKKRVKSEWNLSIYNAYARKNAWNINLRHDDAGKPYAEMIYLFGIVPSITYNFKF